MSSSFRTPSQALMLTLSLGIAPLISAAAPIPQPLQDTARFGAVVRAALAQATTNFSAWRAAVKSTDAYGVDFKSSAVLNQLCPACSVADEYASADSDERYALQFDWIVPPSWSRSQILAFIQANVGELVPVYAMEQGTDSAGENWFDWTTGSPKKFVYVRTFSKKAGNGFEVRVGHYLPKNIHYTPYARLTAAQRSSLADAVRAFVQLGVQNGSDNFSSLRGHATDKDKNYFDTNVSFGEYLKTCNVDGIFADLASSGGTSKWILECQTPSLGGSKSDIESIIQSAISGALPDGFERTTDSKYLGTDDFRWDRSSDAIAVDVSAFDNDDGTFDYTVYVYHFTS